MKQFNELNNDHLNKNFFILLFYNLRNNKSLLIAIINSRLKKFLLPYFHFKFLKKHIIKSKKLLIKK